VISVGSPIFDYNYNKYFKEKRCENLIVISAMFANLPIAHIHGGEITLGAFDEAYHPVTLERQSSQQNFQILLDVLDNLKDMYLIFTMPNADTDGRIIK